MTVRLYLVRHGQTIFNAEDKRQGWSDSFLTPMGIEGVQRLGQYWHKTEQKFDKIYSSDSGRTLQTTRVLQNAMNNKQFVIPTEGLREYNFGYYEGYSNNKMNEALKKYLDIDMTDFNNNPKRYIDAMAELDRIKKASEKNTWFSETSEEYYMRLVGVMNEIAETAIVENHKDILVVSHGMTINYIAQLLDEERFKQFREGNQGMPNASVTTITYNGNGFRLESLAEVKE